MSEYSLEPHVNRIPEAHGGVGQAIGIALDVVALARVELVDLTQDTVRHAKELASHVIGFSSRS